MKTLLLMNLLIYVFAGCSTGFNSGGKVVRVDPYGLYDTNMGFSSEDLHLTVEKMVSSMLKSKLFDGTPVLDVREIENRTDEHIDTKSITDSIRTMVIKSKRARFIDRSMQKILIQELEYQNSSKYMDKSKVKIIGKHIAQNYILDGAITAIKQRNRDQRSYFYKIMLQLHNIETGTIDWIEEKEIKKVYQK